jgi:hypothetical protein
MPELELLVKPLIDRPGKAMALPTPGSSATIDRPCGGSRFGAVRARRHRAAGQSPDQVLLVLRGTKPPGTALNISPVSAQQQVA